MIPTSIDFNKVEKERAHLYGDIGWVEKVREEYLSDLLEKTSRVRSYQRFHGLTGEKARQLLAVLPQGALNDRQNLAPTLKLLLEVAGSHPGQVFLSGYLIDSSRWDERVSVDTLIYLDDFTMKIFGELAESSGGEVDNLEQQRINLLNSAFPIGMPSCYDNLHYPENDYPNRLDVYRKIAVNMGFEGDKHPPDEIYFGQFPWLDNRWGWRIWWD